MQVYQNGVSIGDDFGVNPGHAGNPQVISSASKKIAFSLADVNEQGEENGEVKIDDLMMFDSALTQTQINLLKDIS